MVDEMVLRAQRWVNATYSSVSGYNRCAEDGSTGWGTVYSLTRALQHELGITALSDNFGPTTLSRLTAYGQVGPESPNRNIRIIVQAALYCKGYNGGEIDGDFGYATDSGLSALTGDMGIYDQVPRWVVTAKMFKALLTMDAYVLLNNGQAAIRTCQKWLNRTYLDRGQFFIGPCDGVFSRAMQQALILAIQYQLGMTDSQVTGYIGPGTKSGLRSQALVSTTQGTAAWIRLFQTAMACNNYFNEWGDSGGVFTERLAGAVRAFQEFCKLSQTRAGDYATWMSLLVSTGDPDRAGTAFDVMYPLNRTTIATAKSLGYRIVGRYLNGGTNKVLTNSEIALIFDNGMSIFPLYQEFGDKVGFFSYDQGFSAGFEAKTQAAKFGFPEGTVIYFSVDFDAQDHEITGFVIPHFRGIIDGLKMSSVPYAVGVYGCRNVCIRLADEGLTTRSFVSGMSAGYSGNLGFRLPDNWAFDQIRNFTVPSGSGTLELDNDIVSGRDLGVDSVTRRRDPNDAFYTYLIWLEARAKQWREDHGHTTYSQAELVGQYLRMLDPVTNNKVVIFGQVHVSDKVFGSFDPDFLTFVAGYAGKPDLLPVRDPELLWDMDVSHFGASFSGVLYNGIPNDFHQAVMTDFGSWGGDLLSILGQCVREGVTGEAAAYYFATERIAARADNTYYDLADWMSDVDAVVMGARCRADRSLLLSALFQQYYGSRTGAKNRFREFTGTRFGGSRDVMIAAAQAMFGDMNGGTATLIRNAFWEEQDFGHGSPSFVDAGIRTGVARAFADTAERFANL